MEISARELSFFHEKSLPSPVIRVLRDGSPCIQDFIFYIDVLKITSIGKKWQAWLSAKRSGLQSPIGVHDMNKYELAPNRSSYT
jgi:hypothetical protein